ncbi:MAG: RdgB/HAM1 family non-canonical purine NTP pyrophosphatase [Alphaproteobacteria bacterium]|nr:RdgB/HAM1 family non-canonical purine NTP pyrophosphatase [Alphaproteobacteria bacterium]
MKNTQNPPTPSDAKSLLIATHNEGKFREFAAIFSEFAIDCLNPAQFGLGEPEETGTTFRANAELKAKAAGLGSNRPALADDSGLCVTALNGAPGIYSARWAVKNAAGKADFAPAMAKIAAELEGKPDRSAQFVCALSLAIPRASDHGLTVDFITVEGVLPGEICYPPRGENGFGYDAIFMPIDPESGKGMGQSFAECAPDLKNRISHRALAIRLLLAHPQFQAWLR